MSWKWIVIAGWLCVSPSLDVKLYLSGFIPVIMCLEGWFR